MTLDGVVAKLLADPYAPGGTIMRGLELAREGVALLVRSVWLEGAERYRSLFAKHPPAIVAQFVERVPMTKGRWDPDASTATAVWFVWSKLSPRHV